MNRHLYKKKEYLTYLCNKYKNYEIYADNCESFLQELKNEFNIENFYPTCDQLIDFLLHKLDIQYEVFFKWQYKKLDIYTDEYDKYKVFVKSDIDFVKDKDNDEIRIFEARISINNGFDYAYRKFYILKAIFCLLLHFNKKELDLIIKNKDQIYKYYFVDKVIARILISIDLFFKCIEENKTISEMCEIFNTNREIIEMILSEYNITLPEVLLV